MTIINQLIKRIFAIHDLSESIKTAEKAKIPILKEEASQLFDTCYNDFKNAQERVNFAKSGSKDHAELHVVLAEAAYYTENFLISRQILERYLQLSPQFDQFYCRAKITLGLIINNEADRRNGNESINYHKLAVGEIIKALDVAVLPTNLSRYTFLVFNVSVAFWKIVNPFLRSGRAKFFAVEIGRVVSALEIQDDVDKDWRIMFLSAAAVCLEDDKQSKGAVDYVDKAVEHAEALLALTLKEEEGITAEHTASNKELESIMSAFRRIEEREELLSRPPRVDPDLPDDHVYVQPTPPPLDGLAAQGYDQVKELLDESQRKKALADGRLRVITDKKTAQQEKLTVLYMQRVAVNPTDSKRFTALPAVVKYARANALVQLQCMMCGAIPDKEWEASFSILFKKLSELPSSTARNETLLDVCRAAWQLKQREIALKCYELVNLESSVSPVIRVKLDICDAIHSLADLTAESANKLTGSRLSAKQTDGYRVNRRIEAVKLLERTVGVCLTRLDDRFLVQEICLLMWNACIPLLQPHLRMKVYSSLKAVATSLETVASPLTALRMQVHFELSKCEEQSDFVVMARTEGEKALHCDYGSLGDANTPSALTTEEPIVVELDRTRPMDQVVGPFVSLLALRSSVFDTPSDAEGRALMWIQQARESKSKAFITDMATKALYVMLEEVRNTRGASADVSLAQDDEGSTAVSADLSLMLMMQGPLTIPTVSLEEIEQALDLVRTGPYQPFTKLLQTRCNIMFALVQLGHSLTHVEVLQQAACFLLGLSWDPSDPLLFGLVDQQVQTHYLLADSLLQRVIRCPYKKPFKMPASEMVGGTIFDSDVDSAQSADPRSLGLNSDVASPEMMRLKQLVVTAIDRGVRLAVAFKDSIGVQNGLIYFWNLHLHIFRSSVLCAAATDEVFEFLKAAVAVIETVRALVPATADPAMLFDDRIRISYLETLAGFLESRGQLSQALEVATKGSSSTTAVEYTRRKICEMTSRLGLLNAATAGAAGTKGGAKNANGVDSPKFDNPLLNVFANLAQAELPVESVPREQAVALVDRTVALLEGDVAAFLASQVWAELTQERFSQLLEMQAECWTRLTRLRILFGDIIGSQYTAEKCLALVAKEALSEVDATIVSNRVWRWISVCERLFGIAITNIIQPTGQDMALQNELRLVALSHLMIATNYGVRAKNEALVVAAASNAWNTTIPLVDFPELRKRLFDLQRVIVNNLLQCKGPVVIKQVMVLRQQFYLAMIEGCANIFDWDGALKLVLEAFDCVSSELQKPLWQWRVISMSKKGKNVLDGLQKLKESDPSLQAQVFIILARSSNNPKQQLESYMRAVEILREDMERVDYMLEVAQWMATTGIPRADIREMLLSAMDALYEVEERCMPEVADLDEDEAEEQLAHGGSSQHIAGVKSQYSKSVRSASQMGGSRHGSKTIKSVAKSPSVKSSAQSRTQSGNKSAAGRSKAAGSVRSGRTKGSNRGEPPVDVVPNTLNFKQVEQTVRGLVMLAALESKTDTRLEKHVEAVYFVRKALQMWFEVLIEANRKNAFHSQTEEARAATPLEDFETPTPVYLTLPEEPVLLIDWIHTHQKALIVLMRQVGPAYPLEVPSAQSLPMPTLTIHYLLQLSQALFADGYCKYSLLCLGFVRLLLITVTPVLEGYEVVLVAVYLQTVRILHNMGLDQEALAASPIVVGTATDPLVTVSSFLLNYIKQSGSGTATSKGKTLEKLADYSSPFGIVTWTPQLDGSVVDTPLILLVVCDLLLELGQVALCHNLALSLQKTFQLRDNPRALIQCDTLLSRLSFLGGRYLDVVGTTLAGRELMSKAGDATQLAIQTQLLVKAYLRVGNVDEARHIASFSLELLEDSALQSVDKQGMKQQQQQNNASNQTLRTMQGAQSGVTLQSAAANRQQSALTDAPQADKEPEASYENVSALVTLTLCYVDALLLCAKQSMADNLDPRPLYMEICDRLGRCHDLVCDVAGSGSSMSAVVLEKRATVALTLLTQLHEMVSGVVPLDMYAMWMLDNVLMASEYMERVVEIRRILLDGLPESEGFFTSEDIVGRAGESSKDGVSAALPYKAISMPASRNLAAAQMELSRILLFYASLKAQHQSKTIFGEPPELSVEQRYLQETRPSEEVSLQDFAVPPLSRAAQLASAAVQLLVGSDLVVDSTLLFSTSLVMKLGGEGAFDATWSPQMDSTAPVGEVLLLSVEAREERNKLSGMARSAIEKGRLGCVREACAALVESFGCNASSLAACWVFQMQSLAARDWLSGVWLDVLNPSSEVAAAHSRLRSLEEAQWPSGEAVKQIAAERVFLSNASVAYRRLSVTTDPALLINGALPQNCIALCLQFCPLRETLYVCAGSKVQIVTPVAAPTGKPPAKGAVVEVVAEAASTELNDNLWVVDKFKLSESNRRALHIITLQHRAWLADMTKFVAIHGENTSGGFDLADSVSGSASVVESKPLRKAEHALEERLRALVTDLESIFEPLLGATSKVAGFLGPLRAKMAADRLAALDPKVAPVSTNPSLVMFVDVTLQSLPWEALQLMALFEGCTSRDFSLHMFQHRLQALTTTPVADPPALVSAPAVGLSVPSTGVRYIVDPLQEDPGNKSEDMARESMTQTLNGFLARPDVVGGGAKWLKVRDCSGVASLQDWTLAVDLASQKSPQAVALLAYTLGRVGSLLSPAEIVAMNLERLSLFVSVDLGHSDSSYRRQNSVDVLKRPREIESEQPLVVAAVMALSGTGSQLIHLWSTPFPAQIRLLSIFWRSFTVGRRGDRVVYSLADANNNNTSFPQGAAPVAPAVAAAAVGSAPSDMMGSASPPIKKWVRLSRVLYGVPHITYTDL